MRQKTSGKELVGYYQSPVGWLRLVVGERGLRSLDYVGSGSNPKSFVPEAFGKLFRQLDEYFAGKRKRFDIKLDPQGTEFQKRVWRQLVRIPYGKAVSYREVAKRIGKPKAYRAVGNANGKNPIPVIVPCHRVIANDGGLGGYTSGLTKKRKLLNHEGFLGVV